VATTASRLRATSNATEVKPARPLPEKRMGRNVRHSAYARRTAAHAMKPQSPSVMSGEARTRPTRKVPHRTAVTSGR
jgi:hypothetical protein